MKKTKEQESFDFDAFVSYSHVDSERVKQLYSVLTERFHLQLFLDEKHIGIGPLHQQCAEGIRKSRCLVIVCSHSSLKSDWVLAEHDMMRARDPRGQSIVPVVLDESKLPLALEALLWLDFQNAKEDMVNAAKLASILLRDSSEPSQEWEQSILIEHGSLSPFQGSGIISAQSKCYVRRSCDIQLRNLVASKSFAWIQGGYRMGKSSLLMRYGEWVPGGWHIARPHLELCTPKSEFWKAFFGEIQSTSIPKLAQHEFNPADKWRGLFALAQKVPMALILDEIGICDGSNGRQLLRALLAIKEASPAHFSCIATFKGFPQDYIELCKCDEPKLRDCWKVVSIPRFNHDEAQELTALLPSPISNVLGTRLSRIEQATGFRPHAVQQLLDQIWDSFEGFSAPNTAVIESIVEAQLASFSAT